MHRLSEDYNQDMALKLLRLSSETLDTLLRFRRGGEQKVTVAHVSLVGDGSTVEISGSGVGAISKTEASVAPVVEVASASED